MKDKNKKEDKKEEDKFENIERNNSKSPSFNIDDILKKILESRK